jgi:hypothetical protein
VQSDLAEGKGVDDAPAAKPKRARPKRPAK